MIGNIKLLKVKYFKSHCRMRKPFVFDLNTCTSWKKNPELINTKSRSMTCQKLGVECYMILKIYVHEITWVTGHISLFSRPWQFK